MTDMKPLPPITSRTQLQEALPSSTPPSPSGKENFLALKAAKETAKKILSRYPDYDTASETYLAAVTEILSTFSPLMQAELANIVTGVSAKCRFLPKVADIVQIANEIGDKAREPSYKKLAPDGWRQEGTAETRRAAVKRIMAGSKPPSERPEFRPFPRLWEAFEDEPGLLKNRPFNTLFDASRQLAMHGKEAARVVLR